MTPVFVVVMLEVVCSLPYNSINALRIIIVRSVLIYLYITDPYEHFPLRTFRVEISGVYTSLYILHTHPQIHKFTEDWVSSVKEIKHVLL